MAEKIRFVVQPTEDKARLKAAELELKGYTVAVETTGRVKFECAVLRGVDQVVTADDGLWLVSARK